MLKGVKPAFPSSPDPPPSKMEALGFKFRMATLQNPYFFPILSPHLPEVLPRRKRIQTGFTLKGLTCPKVPAPQNKQTPRLRHRICRSPEMEGVASLSQWLPGVGDAPSPAPRPAALSPSWPFPTCRRCGRGAGDLLL